LELIENIEGSVELGYFENTDEFVSLEVCPSNESKYTLKELDKGEIDLLRNIILNLEKNENVILCTRGNSKVDEKRHETFIKNELYDLFVVGDKAQYHLEEKLNIDPFSTTEKNILLDKIKDLLPSVNKQLNLWSSRYSGEVEGQFTDKLIHDLNDEETSVIESWRIFLYSLLHNHGENFFKPYSFFISLTHGDNKYKTAMHFALDNNKDVGFIFVYILDKNNDNYITASELPNQLEKYGIKWFPDHDNEIMIINGLYPKNIIGFFEVEKEKTKRFILNNWFYEKMKQDTNYDFSQGVYVDQGKKLEKFRKSARNLNIRSYFFTHDAHDGKEFTSDIDDFDPREVSNFKLNENNI
jgi:hypothetical protein